MTNQSVRVQMSPQTKEILENLALQYGCLYGGKANISGLLAQIADGRLTLEKNVPFQSVAPRIPLLKVRMWLPAGIRGMFARIAETIADFGGNIFQAEAASEVDRRGVASILFSIPEEADLSGLMTKLQKIRIRDIAHCNSDSEILAAISNTKGLMVYDQAIDTGTESQPTANNNQLTERIYRKKLLLKISCTIGLRIVATNQVGLLAKVTREVAEQGFFIALVQQNFNSVEHLDIIELLISLEPHPWNKMSQDIEKIKTITSTIERIPGIEDVRRLGMDNLWNIHSTAHSAG